MRRAALARLAAACLAGAGCVTDGDGAPGDYPVDAVALLAPLAGEPAIIDGPIEVLGTGMPSSAADTGRRTFAAYHVAMPDGVTALVVLVSAASCADREPLSAPDDPVPVQSLGRIRRVGDDTHFFDFFVDDGRFIDVDIETSTAYLSRGLRFPRIVIAADPDDLRTLACGEVIWR